MSLSSARQLTVFRPRTCPTTPRAHRWLDLWPYRTLLLAAFPVLAVLLGVTANHGFAQQRSVAKVIKGFQQSPSQATNRAVIVRGSGFVQSGSGRTRIYAGQSPRGQRPVPDPIVVRQSSAVAPPATNRVAPASPPNDALPNDALQVRRLEPPLPTGVDHLRVNTLQPIKLRVAAPPLPTEEQLAADPNIDPFVYLDADRLKVKLAGQFETRPISVSLQRLTHVVVPTDRDGEQISNAGLWTTYEITENLPEPVRTVRIRNRFGEQELTLGRPLLMLVPAGRQGGPIAAFDHYKCFVVLKSCPKRRVESVDPNSAEPPVMPEIGRACVFCVPVTKTHDGTLTEITEPDTHLTFYATKWTDAPRSLDLQDQFRTYNDLRQRKQVLIGVPTYKLDVFPPVPRYVTPVPNDDNQAARSGTPLTFVAATVAGVKQIQQYLSSWGTSSL